MPPVGGGWPRRSPGGFELCWLLLSKWLRSNQIWNQIENEQCKFTNLLHVCRYMNAWVSTCWNACVCLELIHKLKITHWSVSAPSLLTQTRSVCVCQNGCQNFAACNRYIIFKVPVLLSWWHCINDLHKYKRAPCFVLRLNHLFKPQRNFAL